MNEFKKEMIKRELKNATEEELNEILGSLLEVYNETYLKFLDSQIEKRKEEKEEYEKMVKSEIINIVPKCNFDIDEFMKEIEELIKDEEYNEEKNKEYLRKINKKISKLMEIKK